MGQTLSEPVTEKHTTVVQRGRKYWVGLSDMQGWRISMEDAHSVHLHIPPSTSASSSKSASKASDSENESSTNPAEIPVQPAGSTVSNDAVGEEGNALFGVFDGHGGNTVAKFTGTTLHTRLIGLDTYKNGEYEKALKETFLKTDEDLRADPNFFNDPSGCTSVVALITTDGRIIVANSGDSRSVLGYRGEAKPLSFDHKPTNADETSRIKNAGGFVEFGRVNGNLALSRAIGDFEFKQNFSLSPEQQIVTADPDINIHKIDGEEEFLVLACDGIWDCLTSQQVVDFTRRAIANGDPLGKIAEDMMTKCLAPGADTGGLGCDNMTVVIVALLGGRTKEEWQAWVKERVNLGIGHQTPESLPELFTNSNPSQGFAGLTGGGPGGFRVSGAGGLANIASMLGAGNITFNNAAADDDDSDEDEDLHSGSHSESANTSSDKDSDGDAYMDDKALKAGTQPKDVTKEMASHDSTSSSVPSSSSTDPLNASAKSGSVLLVDDDGDSHMASDTDSDTETETEVKHSGTPGSGPHSAQQQKQTQEQGQGEGQDQLLGQNKAHLLDQANQEETTNTAGKGSPIAPSFTSMGSPAVPTPKALQALHLSGGGAVEGKSKSKNQSGAPGWVGEGESENRIVDAEGKGQGTADASPQEQLRSDPQGDEASGAVKVEGLMDGSEGRM